MLPRSLILAAVLTACALPLLVGCGEQGGDALSKEQVELASKSDQIIKSANGKWDNLSAEDKAYLIKEIGYGDERNARMFFDAKSGNLRGAPPTGGQPGAPASAPK